MPKSASSSRSAATTEPSDKNVFKYYKCDRIGVLETLKVRFSPIAALNDPFEFRHSFGFLNAPGAITAIVKSLSQKRRKELAAKMGLHKPTDREITRRVLSRTNAAALQHAWILSQGDANRAWRIFCLSRVTPQRAVSELLWAHYTDGHKGFVLEFDSANSWVAYKRPWNREPYSGDVAYARRRVPGSMKGRITPAYAFTKSPRWRHEKEFRIIRNTANAHDLDRSNPDSDALVRFPPEALVSVTVGEKMAAGDVERIRSILGSNPRLKHVRLHYAKTDPVSFRINLSEEAPSPEVLLLLNRARARRGKPPIDPQHI